MELSLAEQLVLLSYDDVTGRALVPINHLDCGIEGAVLLSLANAGRIAIRRGHVEVVDHTLTGDPSQDAALMEISDDAKGHAPDWWIYHLASPHHRQRLLDNLVAKGVLRHEDHRVVGVFHRPRYPLADQAVKKELVDRLRNVVNRIAEPDRDSVSLLALTHTMMLDRHYYPEVNHDDMRHRVMELAEGEWAAPALGKVIYAMNMAVMAAVTGGIASSSTAAVSGS
ncbi:GOLPH3/VPS74 family protein [Catellatospora vulcania]|uniref:GOLPH3/VPS74 family protein n=1 Tax=Catellatospora vulcania TaxID=1460450 RepID=UPI0012D38F62|nr:GPP34 family phosphoprotein [Catellatospora vulcania]